MIHQNVALHNVEAVTRMWDGCYRLQRVPETVRTALNPGAQEATLAMANSEIRFAAESDAVTLTLKSNGSGEFRVAYGDFIDPTGYPLHGGKLTYELKIPESIGKLKAEQAAKGTFSTQLFRILLPMQQVFLYEVKGLNVRPPLPGEVPEKRYLAYGTSITQGGCASIPHMGFTALTARESGLDLINLGMSGSCHIEKELVDHIAERGDWDVATLELSVNMVSQFTSDEFKERVAYALEKIAGRNPGKPVICISIFPYFADLCDGQGELTGQAEAFRRILRNAVEASPHKNLQFVEGESVLDRLSGLTSDLIHPSDFGMMRMARNLTGLLSTLVGQ